jgi:ribonuclease PH
MLYCDSLVFEFNGELFVKRIDGRANDTLRDVSISLNYLRYAEGSALITLGNTRIICAATIEERVPNFLKGQGVGWITAEYAMLPRSTHTRTPRATADKNAGRSHEIQRLIGRSLRAAIDMAALGERTITIDCDVLQADGGTRTAAITGGYVALYQALNGLKKKGVLTNLPLRSAVAATSVGIVDREELLDLCYEEDSRASVDFNIVKTNKGEFVEIQGTAEGKPFSKLTIDSLLALADKGIRQLFDAQKAALNDLR